MPRESPTRPFITAPLRSAMGEIQLAGFIPFNRGISQSAMRRLGSYAFVLILEGGGFFGDGLATPRRRVNAGDLIWVFPEVPHYYGPGPGEAWQEVFAVFNGPLPELCRRLGTLRPEEPVWRLGDGRPWRRSIERWLRRRESAEEKMAALLGLITKMHAARKDKEREEGFWEPWLDEAARLLEGGPEDEPGEPGVQSLPELAQRLGVSYESFRKKFRARFHVSPQRYRLTRRIDRACGLICRGLTNKEVADRLGFADEFHFSRTFQARMGFPPRVYRRQIRGG